VLADQEDVGLDRVFKAIMDPMLDPETASVSTNCKLMVVRAGSGGAAGT
jgi:hypothetical protein